ncbi:hypothetical protein [Actinoplanes sp. NPDC026623]|uniref:hypothetical protein n=1 Tax=Actinoplanes sp. NPDC026623 TaxID=3155610 RepID=UPI0033E1256D
MSGLRVVRAGADVRVYERDAAPDSRRLHVGARAGLALERCRGNRLLLRVFDHLRRRWSMNT